MTELRSKLQTLGLGLASMPGRSQGADAIRPSTAEVHHPEFWRLEADRYDGLLAAMNVAALLEAP